MQISIAISVHNRHETAKECVKQWRKYLPKNANLFIVDDGSDVPFPGADIRNEKAKGIAACKNQCLTLCDDADFIFLSDDDIWPKTKDWHLPYIESGLNHLCFTFDHFSNGNLNGRRKIKEENGISTWHEPCGLLLFFTKKCLEVVGGMDESYGAWGYEHLQLSRRIYNNGLIPQPYMDVASSLDLFHSLDYDQTIVRSVDPAIRNRLALVNKKKYLQDMPSKAYIPYKQQTGIILTSYFTGVTDPQRGEKWTADLNQIHALANSSKENNCRLHVLHDCFEKEHISGFNKVFPNVSFEDVKFQWKEITNPYFKRWFHYNSFVSNKLNRKGDNIFFVDCNDVEVLKNPFQIIKPGVLYCGWEKDFIGCQWMQNNHKSNFMQNFIKSNVKTPLLNAGVVGGRYDIVMEFLNRLCDMYEILPEKELDMCDMPLFNWTVYSHFLSRFITGPTITTEFKRFEKNNKLALFSHK